MRTRDYSVLEALENIKKADRIIGVYHVDYNCTAYGLYFVKLGDDSWRMIMKSGCYTDNEFIDVMKKGSEYPDWDSIFIKEEVLSLSDVIDEVVYNVLGSGCGTVKFL